MINLRFHMVSLVAVFFALAIGIAIGATVVDQGVLTQTERRLSSFDAKLQERDRSLSALRKQLRAEKALVDQLGPKANTGRLQGRSFVLVALPDVPIETVRAASRTLSNAGAEVAGSFRLDRTLGLNSQREQRDARAFLNVPEVSGKGGLAGLRSAMDARLAQSFAAPLLAPALGSLVDAGFLKLVGSTKAVTLPSTVETVLLERSSARGEAVGVDDGFSEESSSLSSSAATGPTTGPTTSPTTGAGTGVVTNSSDAPSEVVSEVASAKDSGSDSGGSAVGLRFVLAVRSIDAHKITVAMSGNSLPGTVTEAVRVGELRDAVSTVDGVETVGGASGLVFALAERPTADAAHFGLLRGARRRIAR
jgi:hypothetical protein